jgi:tRNA threonylcarbamoyl adenosine modification protein YeaZ
MTSAPLFATGPVLVLEAATAVGSVALLTRDHEGAPVRLIAERTVAMGGGRADQLTTAVQGLLGETGLAMDALSAVACGSGPGSFTSLRIAGAFAKGLVYGLGRPLYAIPSLLLAVPAHGDDSPRAGRYVVTTDALRGEVFAQRLRVDEVGLVLAEGVAVRGTVAQVASGSEGETHVAVAVAAGVHPRAGAARWLADWSRCGPVDLDRWEPDYGRLAEAQVQWEATHGRPLPAT